ncbi:MAG TPA: hypothetical protein EYG68_01480 [Leucothrix mucor]|nr:hypothetical protein [Leucothrix mucor]
MVENVALVNTLSGQNIANQQQYPVQKPEQEDVLKFKLELHDSNKALPPIFEAIDKSNNTGDISKGVLSHIQNADASYHNILTGMNGLSNDVSELKFKTLSSTSEDFAVRTSADVSTFSNEDFVRTPDDVSNKSSSKVRELLDIQGENQTKALEMMHDMTSWTIRTQMYFSNIKIIGTAITQVSQGFKTLFRSSG